MPSRTCCHYWNVAPNTFLLSRKPCNHPHPHTFTVSYNFKRHHHHRRHRRSHGAFSLYCYINSPLRFEKKKKKKSRQRNFVVLEVGLWVGTSLCHAPQAKLRVLLLAEIFRMHTHTHISLEVGGEKSRQNTMSKC